MEIKKQLIHLFIHPLLRGYALSSIATSFHVSQTHEIQQP